MAPSLLRTYAMPIESLARDEVARAYVIGVSGSSDSGSRALLLSLCRLLRDNYSIAVVTSQTDPDLDGCAEYLMRHKALASARITAASDERALDSAIEVLMTEFRPELIFCELGGAARQWMVPLADFTIHIVDGSDTGMSFGDVIDVATSDLLVVNKTHLGPPLDVQHNVVVRECMRVRRDAACVFAQLRYGIGTIDIAKEFLVSWRRSSTPAAWTLAAKEAIALTPA
jgi:urease accessory protein